MALQNENISLRSTKVLDLPDPEHLKKSWQQFVQDDLSEIFAELNPIEDYTGQKHS